MKTKKQNIIKLNKTIKVSSFLKPKTLWQKRLKKIADRDLSFIPDNFSNNFKIKGSEGLLILSNNKISFITDKKTYFYDLLLNKSNAADNYRIYSIMNLIRKLKQKYNYLYDLIVPFKFGDGYFQNSNFPYFCYAKPINKNGLLFPHWFFDNWDNYVKEFQKENIPWNKRKIGPFFRGNNTTSKHNKIREKLANIFPTIILKPPFNKPLTELCEYKFVFDLPGIKPWSVRTPFTELSQAQILRLTFVNSKLDEKSWVQFFELNEPNSLKLNTNYYKEINNETLDKIINYVNNSLKKHSLHKSDLFELTENDIFFYLNYLFTKLQKYNSYFKQFLPKK